MEKKIRVLHIDDNIHDRQLIKDVLQKEHGGFYIVEADSREKFEQHLAEGNFDLVLSDFNILGFDGLQVLQIVKEKCPHVPVIIVTGTGSEEIAIQAMKMGASDYVIKSVKHIMGLVPTINSVLELKKAQEERNLAQEALIESQKLFQNLTYVSPVGIFRTREDGFTTYVNPRWSELSGISFDEAIGDSWLNAVHPDDRERLNKKWHEAVNRNQHSFAEYRFLKSDGSVVWVIGNAVPEMKENVVTGYIGTITDITDRKRTEEVLREREEFLSNIIENIPDMIFIKDAKELRLIRLNLAGEKLLGYSREYLLGKNDYDFFSKEQADFFTGKDREVLMNKAQFDIPEEPINTLMGKRILHTKKIPILNNDGEPAYLLGISEDITERKQTEEQLLIAKEKAEESDRLKTAFLNNMSHEVRTPLNGIMGFTNLLNEPGVSPEERDNYTRIINRSGDQLISIIDDIISIATIEAGQEKLNETAVDVNQIMEDLFNKFNCIIDLKKVSLRYNTKLTGNQSMIMADQNKLIKILNNLIGNAIKFSETGTIEFSCALVDNSLQFKVKDTGIGISPEYHDLIFKRFRQVDFRSKRIYGGNGLGLPISKAYAELMGGKMWVESSAGKGSAFIFTILHHPVEIEMERKDSVQTGESDNDIRTPVTVLIVEDEWSNYMLLNAYLTSCNYLTIYATNGLEAIAKFREFPNIGLVLMDLKMPLMNGFEATRIIRSENPTLPIIAITAYALSGDREKAIEAGCNSYLAKPINKNELLEKINQYLK